MSEPRHPAPPICETSEVGTQSCPQVAELIQYGLGQLRIADQQRVEAHLQGTGCTVCKSWIDQARKVQSNPGPKARFAGADLGMAFRTRGIPHPPVNDPTPLPESAKWQREAFRELEKRLRVLDEELG